MRLILALIFALALNAQTTIIPDAVRNSGTVIGVMVCLPPTTVPGKCILAALHSSITLDTSVDPPVLRAASIAPAVTKYGKVVYKLTSAQTAFPLSYAGFVEGSLDVYRNGLLMAIGQDYTMGGTVGAPAILFLPAQTPQPGDIVTMKYVWQ